MMSQTAVLEAVLSLKEGTELSTAAELKNTLSEKINGAFAQSPVKVVGEVSVIMLGECMTEARLALKVILNVEVHFLVFLSALGP